MIEHIEGVDVILHGGDINKQSVVDELRRYAPLYVVRGNNDKDWAADIPHELTVTLGGVTFYMVHNKKEVPADLSGVDAVVFGHSHQVFSGRTLRRALAQPRLLRPAALCPGDNPDAGRGRRRAAPRAEDHHPHAAKQK